MRGNESTIVSNSKNILKKNQNRTRQSYGIMYRQANNIVHNRAILFMSSEMQEQSLETKSNLERQNKREFP